MSTLNQRSNGFFYLNHMVGGRQIRVSLHTKDATVASARYARHLAYQGAHDREPPVHHPENERLPWSDLIEEGELRGKWLYAIYERARDRARSKEIPFNLTRGQLRDIALLSAGRCEVTGLQFTWDKSNYCQFSPFAPTLDRIVPRIGYSASNCRIVCHAANLAMADWGEEVFERIARGFLEHRSL